MLCFLLVFYCCFILFSWLRVMGDFVDVCGVECGILGFEVDWGG